MSRDPRYDVLFEPVRIGPVTARNRFYQVPHCNGMGRAFPTPMAVMRGIKAEGGWAVVCTEQCDVHPSGSTLKEIRLWDAQDIPYLARTTELIHRHGSLAGIELTFMGYRGMNLESREIPMAPSARPVPYAVPITARTMDKTDIRNIRRWLRQGALNARKAGFDLVYVYAGHDLSLPMHFLSRRHNHRSDEYGGSLENRCRLLRELIEETKEAVGDTCAVAVRLAVDELLGADGITSAGEGRDVIEMLAELPDLWDVNVSQWENDSATSRFAEEGYQEPYIDFVKKLTTKPVVGVGRYTSPDHMAQLVAKGVLDFIGAARPSIADPFLPKKIEEGRLDDIRECIGCNQCISRWEIGGPPMVCTQNATAGEEYRRGWHPEKFHPAANRDKGVLVVGAGPAGMECAMVLGKRDMSAVHLVEGAKEIGGSVNWISKLGHSDGKENLFRGTARGLGEWSRIVNYRQIQLDKLGNVEVHLNSRLTAEQVLDYGAEIVIVATGCHYATNGLNAATHEPIPGADTSLDWQLTPDQVVAGNKEIGKRVLVLENEAYFMGASVAQKLAGAGHDVQLVTQAGDIASYMEYTLEAPMLHRDLHRLGVGVHPYTMLERIEPGVCHAYNVWNPAHKEQFEVDTVVLCTARISDDELYRELKSEPDRLAQEGIEAVYVIGDASAPRMIVDSIFDGHRLAREIDSPHPEMPLPFIRERRLWGDSSNDDYRSQLLNTVDVG